MLTDIRQPPDGDDRRTPAASPRAAPFDLEMLETIDGRIGGRIRLRRRQLGMSQAQLSRAIGVTFQQVHKYETGQSAITAARLYAIAGALSCPVAYFYEDPAA